MYAVKGGDAALLPPLLFRFRCKEGVCTSGCGLLSPFPTLALGRFSFFFSRSGHQSVDIAVVVKFPPNQFRERHI